MDNPFKYGLVVDSPYFTDRVKELEYICQFLNGANHLILISPRRYGKTSLIHKAVEKSGRPYLFLSMQQVTSVEDFASMVIRGVFRLFPFEKIKHILANFRIVPTISTSPMGDSVEISFNAKMATSDALIEDALGLLQKVTSDERKLIVVLDEFQELLEVEAKIDKRLRAIMQEQTCINYILLGSQESMMTDIFERVKSPFYHFGNIMHLGKIPRPDFYAYVCDRLSPLAGERSGAMTDEILDFSGCHPYYTQQLAARVWEIIAMEGMADDVVRKAIDDLTHAHDLDFERLWLTMTRVSRKMMKILASGASLSSERNLPQSTSYSAVAKLVKQGYVVRAEKSYEIEDPFFCRWISSIDN